MICDLSDGDRPSLSCCNPPGSAMCPRIDRRSGGNGDPEFWTQYVSALPEPIPFQMGLQVTCMFVLKRRRKASFSQIRRQLTQIFHRLHGKECQILEAQLMPDHIHMCIAYFA